MSEGLCLPIGDITACNVIIGVLLVHQLREIHTASFTLDVELRWPTLVEAREGADVPRWEQAVRLCPGRDRDNSEASPSSQILCLLKV